MENENPLTSEQINTSGTDVTTWALPEGAIARLGQGSIRDMAFSPDEQYFAVGTSIGLWLYELPTLSPIALWDTERGMIDDVIFSPDSRQIVTSTFVENVKIWDVQSGICMAQMPKVDNQEICRPVFSQDGQYLVAANYRVKNRKIHVWCPHTGTKIRETEIQHPYEVYPFCFSPDLSLLAGKNSDKNSSNMGMNIGDGDSITVWQVETGEQVADITGYSEPVRRFCFSPCGRFLAAGSRHGTIHVWDLTSGQLEMTHSEYGESQMYPYFLPEGELVTAAVSQHKLEIWNVETDEKLDEFEHRGNSRNVCFSESGARLAVASESETKIWAKGRNTDTHSLSTLHGHIPTMDTLVFSSDEKTLAAGFWRDNVLLWDVASRRSYRPQVEQLPGTSCNVYRAPDGKIISVNVYGDNLNVWEVDKSEPVVKLPGPEGGLGRAKAFSPTGHRIASVDRNDNIHIWERPSTLNNVTESEGWKKHPTVINDEEFIDLPSRPHALAWGCRRRMGLLYQKHLTLT